MQRDARRSRTSGERHSSRPEARTGVLVTVFPDRIADAVERSQRLGDVLGPVIAHEIGHILLGSTTHSRTGLMRPGWTSDDLRHASPWTWRFAPEETQRMRERLQSSADPAAGRERLEHVDR
jgi:hypothetical protein